MRSTTKSLMQLALCGGGDRLAQAADDVTLRLDRCLAAITPCGTTLRRGGVAKNGININLREGRGSMTTSQTVGNQSDEFGTADGGAMMVLRSKGLKTKMVRLPADRPQRSDFSEAKGWKAERRE